MYENSAVKNLMETDINFNTSIGGLIAAKKILVLAPHADDEVIGCGGTILRYIEAGSEVVIVYFTDGRYGLNDFSQNIRKEEAINAWKGIKINQIFLDYEDSHLHESNATNWLKEFIDDYEPEIIFTPWFLDTHIDHKTTSYFLSNALVEQYNKNVLVAFYEVMFPLYSNKIVNISKQFDTKISIIEKYTSQLAFLDLKEVVIHTNSLRGYLTHLKSIKKAEAFYFCSIKVFISLIQQLQKTYK